MVFISAHANVVLDEFMHAHSCQFAEVAKSAKC